jgi:predicted RNA-binding Zn ribbon-like protein
MVAPKSAPSPTLPFQQGHLASLQDGLDFINTRESFQGRELEELGGLRQALEWLCRHDLMHRDAQDTLHRRASPQSEAALMARIRRVRAALRELVEAAAERRVPLHADLDEINRVLRTHYVYELVPAHDGVSLEHRHQGDPVDGALARLAESVARELIQGHPERLKICQAPDCHYVFADTSRTRRRKWCTMASCGNRAKVARHRARLRAQGEPVR